MQISDRSRRKALQKLETEGHKSIDIMLCSAMIALYRYYGYRALRLAKIMQETQAAWNECANDNNVSMQTQIRLYKADIEAAKAFRM